MTRSGHRLAAAALRVSCSSAARRSASSRCTRRTSSPTAAPRWRCSSAAANAIRSACTASGLALGSAAGLDAWHLDRLARAGAAHRAGARQRPCVVRARTAARRPAAGAWHRPAADRLHAGVARHHGAQRAAGAGAAAPRRSRWKTCRPTCAGPTTRSTRPSFFNELARRSGCDAAARPEQPGGQRAQPRRRSGGRGVPLRRCDRCTPRGRDPPGRLRRRAAPW